MPFYRFDHIDVRVTSLAAVEAFCSVLLPELGLSVKRHAHVDSNGDWHQVTDERPANAVEHVEYYESVSPD